MPYAITPEDESVESALRRIAREEAAHALEMVRATGDLAPRVHEMRKTVKKLRGLLRLARPVLAVASAENAVLRDAGQGLSGLRDAAVQLATAESLSATIPSDRREALLAPFRAAAAHHDARAEAELLPPFADVMDSLILRSEGWRLRREGWDALEPGLKATWAAARRALKAARREPSPEALHEWRKRVKDHWYQARLLRPIWPAMMDPHIKAADDLGEVLGLVNDLAVFRDRLDAADLAPVLKSEAKDLATLRHAELMARALPLGRRLLAGDARALTDRWGTWWTLRDAA
ncbi:CHAD domain-containing protein [Rubellimicrobium aerolatum]|uniref:CHAD domain-containing protein n=1 Tax=Rubellimicrobium aerolatum TaxID=490979 RepID=A0ABW0SGH1_9RHOB|nr:CHAD domain-containing protein [Rubellimicrobium aerolatum]MBP1807464.1 CHAD domain-containing protein [Rubellimicrobium aerolatum]